MKKNNLYAAKVFGLSFVCFLIAVIPIMIRGNGLFTFYSDYDHQNLEFMSNLHYAIRNGGLGWDWFTDLGSSHIESYSYYGLGSPFFWIMMLLPEKLLLPAMPVMLAIKTAVASVTAYLFMRRFSCSEEAATVGGVMYAFSGFQLYNILFYSFHDTVAFFPLLLMAVELHIKDKRRGLFVPIVALCALTNFYFFFGQVIFVLIYIAIRSTDKSFGMTAKGFATLAVEAVLGTLIACVLLYPSFLAVSASGRAGESISPSDMLFYDGIGFYFRFLQSIIMTPDPCLISNLIETPKYKFGSLAPYLPVFSCVFAVAFIRKNKRSWEAKAIVLCLIISLVPLLNSVFSFFNSAYYARWHYMPILLLCMLTARVVDKPSDYPVKSSFLCFLIILLAFTASIFFPVTTDSGKRIMYLEKLDTVLLIPQLVITFVLYGLLAIIVFKLKRDKSFALNCVSFVVIGAIVLSCGFVWSCTSLGHHGELISDNYKAETFDEYRSDDFERVELIDAYSNFNMLWHLPSSKSYISLCSESIAQLYSVLGEKYRVGSSYNSSAYALRGLFSIRYVIDDVEPTAISLSDKTGELTGFVGCTYDGKAGDFYIYENRHFVPIGFAYDTYCTYEDIESLDNSGLRAMLLLEAVLLTDEQVEKYGDIITKYDMSKLALSSSEYYELCDKRAENACDRFEKSSDGFTAHITLEENRLVFFSVPYDEDFTAYVNGKEVPLEKVSGGLMAIPCASGENDIEVVYESTGFRIGLIMSLVGVLMYAIYLPIALRKKKVQ